MANSLVTKSKVEDKKTKLKINKYSQFNLILFFAIFLPMLGAGLFNFIIDPYDIFSSPNLSKLNDVKVNQDNNDRLFKAVDIINIKPITIILGSSRTKQGINPENAVFTNKQPAYNLGLNGTNIYEIKRYLEHSIINQKNLKEVVFGVDFFMFNNLSKNQPSFDETRLAKTYLSPKDTINSLFSLDALSNSWQTLNESLKKNDDPNYGINGFMPNRRLDEGKNKWRFNSGINQYYEFHNKYEFSQKYLNDFQEIVEICQQNNIELKIFISPSHATQWEAIRTTGKWDTFEQWKRKLVKIVPVWDFSGYSSITTESIKDQMNNYADNSHYTPIIGDLVLHRIYNYQTNLIPEDFGVLITKDNIEEHLTNIRQKREVWAKNNPNEVKLVQDIHKKFLSENKTN